MKRDFLLFAICISVLLLVDPSMVLAQQGQQTLPDGSPMQGQTSSGNASWSSTNVWARRANRDPFGHRELFWSAPPGKSISIVGEKYVRNPNRYEDDVFLYITLNDGSVYKTKSYRHDCIAPNGLPFRCFGFLIPEFTTKITDVSTGGLRELIGDDLYAISFTTVYVSRDGGTTWSIDSAGLGGAAPRKLALDSLQNVYLATDKGLFKQSITGTTWLPVASMTKNLRSVFIDRKNKWIYTGTQSEGIYKSSNLGGAFQNDSSGTGTQLIQSFIDDSFGNIYARTLSNLYRSTAGTQPWLRVDAGLINKTVEASISINGVSADSVLLATTNFGLFASSDQGSTWTDANNGTQSDNAYGLIKLPSGRFVATTDLGVFTLNSGGTAWTRTLPTNAYQQFAAPVQRDRNGMLYTSNAVNIYKSTDNGTTWTQDNPGWQGAGSNGVFVPFQPGLLYVDETGVQHYCPNPPFQQVFQFPSTYIYLKSGGNWVADQTGMTLNTGDQFYGYSSDQQGNLFIFLSSASGVRVYRRAIGGGTWSPDTAGLSGKALISMARDRSGNMVGGAQGGGIYRRVNGVWSPMSAPSAISTNDVAQVSIDSSNAIFAALQVPGLLTGRGVYYSKDNGVSWTFAGLDSILVRKLVSSGDTTFALTSGRGVVRLRSTPFAFAQPVSRSLFFDNVKVGQSKDLPLSVANTGIDSLRISNITSSNTVFVPQQTKVTLGPNQPTAVTIRFTPSSITTFSSVLVVTSNSSSSPDSIALVGVGVSATTVERLEGIPTEFSLSQNFPNPFNPSTTIRYAIPIESRVLLEIYNLLGQRVATLVDEEQNPAYYQTTWNASGISSGMYFYRLQADSFIETKKLLLLK